MPDKKFKPAEKKVSEPAKAEVAKAKKPFDVEKKIKIIEDSKMPDWQKKECIAGLERKELPEGEKVSFNTYAAVKCIGATLKDGMRAYPGAKGVIKASVHEWDEIYKKF